MEFLKNIFWATIVRAQVPGEGGGGTGLTNPLGVDNVQALVSKAFEVVVQVGLPVAAVFIVWAGMKFITAGGDETKVKEAKKMFFWTIIGTAVLLGAWVIVKGIEGTINSLK